ncbi:hypothetical protein QQ045_024989 [Rhodiola kirilowii]
MESDLQVQSLLSSTANVWLPVITATFDKRHNFTLSPGGDGIVETDGEIDNN